MTAGRGVLRALALGAAAATLLAALLNGPGGPAEPNRRAVTAGGRAGSVAVEPLWRPGQEQHGVNVLFYADGAATGAGTAERTDRTADVLTTLHANAVAIAFPFYTDGPDADAVGPGPGTPSPALVGSAAAGLNRRGFRVTLRPLLDEAAVSGDGGWRGTLAPRDRDAWFASYREFLAPYLVAAGPAGVTTFDIGSELESLEADRRWDGLIAWAASRFTGEIAYAQNWSAWQSAGSRPDALLAVDAYPPFAGLADTAGPEEVEQRWRQWLRERPPDGTLVGTVLREVGIPAQEGAYAQPYRTARSTDRVLPEIQEHWFTAACRAQRSAGMAGVYFWALDLNADPRTPPPRPDPTTFLRAPAEAAIRECFAARR